MGTRCEEARSKGDSKVLALSKRKEKWLSTSMEKIRFLGTGDTGSLVADTLNLRFPLDVQGGIFSRQLVL